MQLREESERLLNKRLDEKSTEDQEPENIEISRNFKDQVVSLQYLNSMVIKVKLIFNFLYKL